MEFKMYDYYRKTIPIIQNSGTGKSQLDEISKGKSFVLRLPGEKEYPPGDLKILELLTGARDVISFCWFTIATSQKANVATATGSPEPTA